MESQKEQTQPEIIIEFEDCPNPVIIKIHVNFDITQQHNYDSYGSFSELRDQIPGLARLLGDDRYSLYAERGEAFADWTPIKEDLTRALTILAGRIRDKPVTPEQVTVSINVLKHWLTTDSELTTEEICTSLKVLKYWLAF